MTPAIRPLLAALLLVAAGTSSAEIFRCKAHDGAVTYQQDPCGPSTDGGAVNIPVSYPDYAAERDRLAMREAALDARLLKRLEIEAAERIARDDRAAREKAAQAQAQDPAVYGGGRLLFVSRHPPRHPFPVGVR
jgi:Domain of unknown function (DUF4124)